MRDEESLKFRRRNLKAVVLDEFFHPVDDRHVMVFIDDRNVTSVQPTVAIKGGRRRLRIIEVTLHDLRATNPQLAAFPERLIFPSVRVNDAAFGI